MWLGHPEPGNALLDQVKHDPDSDALAGLLTEWLNAFGSTPTTVRKAVDRAEHLPTCSTRCVNFRLKNAVRSIAQARLVVEEECNRIVRA